MRVIRTIFHIKVITLFVAITAFVSAFVLVQVHSHGTTLHIKTQRAEAGVSSARAEQLVVDHLLRRTRARYSAIRHHLVVLVNRHNPRVAFDWLRALKDRDPAVLRSCHFLTHDIGRAAYRKYGDFARALRYLDDQCGLGYVHGVVEARLAASSNVYFDMVHLCDAYTRTVLLGRCYHGIGHGLMLMTHNDLPVALQFCNHYADPTERKRCAAGVFMENFNTELRAHPSRYVRPSNPFYPCPQQTTFYKQPCYFYPPMYFLSLHYEDYRGVLRWCETAESLYRLRCVAGAGSYIEQQNIGNTPFVERMCATARAKAVDACIDGVASYYLVHFNSVRRAWQMCGRMLAVHQRACYGGVRSRRQMFGG